MSAEPGYGPVNPLHSHAVPAEELGESVGAVLRSRESQDAAGVGTLEERQEEARLHSVATGYAVWVMPVAGAAGRSTAMVTGSRRISRASATIGAGIVAEKRRVWRRAGSCRSTSTDVRQKAHVEHAVRLVEHQHLHAGQAAVGLTQVVQQATRRGHEDVDPAVERLLLGDVARPRRRRRPR